MAYRKYLEPKYGEVAPEVNIMAPQTIDLEHINEWRAKSDLESVSAMSAAYQKCACYDNVMRVQTEDVWCTLAGENVRIRIYGPRERKDCPVTVFYHGGAYSMNSIEVYEYVYRYLTYYGNMVVIAPDYHLAPEYKFPRGLNESYDALVWAAENAAAYGGNADKLYVCGDSSGGNFAAVVSRMARDKKGPSIKGQILYYPLTTNYEEEMTYSEKRYGKGYFLDYNCMDDPMYLYFNTEEERKDPLASPLLEDDLTNLPDACFISAECDPLLDQGLQYAAKLEDNNVAVEYHIMEGMVHGFLNWTYGKTFDALNYAIAFINK